MTATAVLSPPPETWPEIPERDGYEYVDGRWVKLAVGMRETLIGFNVRNLLAAYAEPAGLGWSPPPHESPYQISPEHPRRYRKPDASFVRRDALTFEEAPEGFLHTVPALVVEVVSPRDNAVELDQKIAEYLEAGVELVWVLNPKTRVVMVYRGDGSTTRLVASERLGGETVLPGFSVEVGRLFETRIP
ncbi:MAG: Uma2 family endonuclease [Dehalococcoidia bacterium]